ncbi:hypothetical protein [Mycobacterium sp. 29Ha]|uniref:hypothetical protein n=1 Tax=Mycobacterium sp. 29Ha TaxID=2939268 RepID=UPI002939074B|nr:hypothetical protein [Mycobacterium sp. 29Ha]MDV3133538.1 hypothetical protein [Mycobacterium sp. 29Ha]
MDGIDGPFLGSEAIAGGRVTRRALQRQFARVYRDVYLPEAQPITPVVRAKAAWLWARRDATLGGLSAAAMLGSKWIGPEEPADLFRLGDAVDGINIHRDQLNAEEVCIVGGIPTTTPARTAFDLARRDTLERAIMRLDALANATRLKCPDVVEVIERHAGARGIVQLRRAVELMDAGAESPQETRTRLLLIAAGFPRPTTQILVYNEFGDLVGRIDLGWPEWKVGVEYDGPQHWATSEAHARTIERIADLEAEGWTIVRLSRDILRYRRGVFLARVQKAMGTAGWPFVDEIRLDAQMPVDLVP